MTDLIERIEQLSDRDAVGALKLVLEKLNPDSIAISVTAEEEERRFRLALAEPEARQQLEARASIPPAPAARDDLTRSGDLARAALFYLADEGGESRDDVAHALDRPEPVGTRDPITLVIVGLVVLALRPKIDIQRDSQEGWKLSFKTEPLKDSAMSKVLSKLLSVISPGSSDE
jgi:hypothetical protein